MAKPQIFNRDMKRLAYLDNAIAVGYGLETNSLWTATFTLPADDPKNAYCSPLNYVEIFDGDERIDLFRIIGEDLERSNGATRYYNCEHVLATLLSDVLFQYHQCGGSGVKTADVLNYILARQTRQNWKLGDCDFKRYFEYNWENSTLLAALFAVPECFDGEYLWSWDTTVYPWTLSLTVPTEALKSEIRYAKNMTNIKKTTDATSIANRVYALGYGEGVNQLTISLLFKAPRLCRPLYRLQIDHDDARPLPDFRSQQLHRLAPIFDRPYRLFTGRDRYRALVLAQ